MALLFCADVAVDSFDADCVPVEAGQDCHACLCGTPATAPRPPAGAVAIPPTAFFFPSLDASFADRLADKSVFRPPKPLA